MNLNKIETDRPGFILPTWWNDQAGKTTDEPKEARKINSMTILSSNESFGFVSEFLNSSSFSQPRKLSNVHESTATWKNHEALLGGSLSSKKPTEMQW